MRSVSRGWLVVTLLVLGTGRAHAAEPLPPGAVLRLGTPSFHLNDICALAVSPDGRWLATAGYDYTIRLTEAKTGREVHRFDTPGFCYQDHSLAFSPDGKHLAAADGTGKYHLWETESGRAELAHPGPMKGKFLIFAPTFSPEGLPLIVLWGDEEGFGLYDARDNSKVHDLEATGGYTRMLVLSPRGMLLAMGSEKRVRVLSLETGRQVHVLEGQGKEITSLAFAHDGRSLAAVTGDGVLRLWDLATGKERCRFALPESQIASGLAVSSDGSWIAVCPPSDRSVRILEKETGKVRFELGTLNAPTSHLAFTPDGRTLAAADGIRARLWDVASGRSLLPEPAGHRGAVAAVAYAPDGRTLASASRDGTLRLWDARTGEALRRWSIQPDEVAIGFAPDGQTLLVIQRECTWAFDPRTGAQRWLGGRWQARSPLVVLPVEHGLLAAPNGSGIDLVQPRTGAPVRRLTEGFRAPSPLACSPDGRFLAVLDPERLALCDTAGGAVQPLEDHPAAYLAAFSGDGRLLAAAEGETLTIWNVATRKKAGEARVQPMGNALELHALAFARDGRTVVLSGWDQRCQERSIRLFEAAGCRERFRLPNPGGAAWSLAFAPDGRHLASANSDTTVTVWDLDALPEPPRVGKRGATEREHLWTELASVDAAVAFRAMRTLVANPDDALSLLRERLQPVAALEARQIERWITDLDSPEFEKREQASRELARLGEVAGPVLRKAAAGELGPEARRRIEQLVQALEEGNLSPETLRQLRAVEALERIGSPAARGLLQALARGAAEARLTREASAAVRRLGAGP